MKKILAIIGIAALFCSCAAEKRLARFLLRHPELQRIDTVYYRDTVYFPADSNAITISLSELVAMDSAASAALTEDKDTTISASVSGDRSNAALQALGNGQFQLSTTAPPDTFYIEVPVEVPVLTTEYKDRDKIVYKQKWYQEGLSWIGLITLIIITIWFILKMIKLYVKPL